MKLRTIALLLSTALTGLTADALAQDPGAIDVFDESVPDEGPITIEGGTGSGTTPSAAQLLGRERRLEYIERHGVMFVKAKVNGRAAYFIFDTGAGYTTLTPAFAKKIGILPGASAPTIQTMTANGPRAAKLGMGRSIRLAGAALGGFVFSTCAPCGGGTIDGKPIVGLLGRNVLNRFSYEVDAAAGVIVMRRIKGKANQYAEIEPFLQANVEPVSRGTRFDLVLTVLNRSPVTLRNAVFSVTCATQKGNTFTQRATISTLARNKLTTKKLEWSDGSSNDACERTTRLELVGGSW